MIIQYKDVSEDLFNGQSKRDELIASLGSTSKLEMKIMSKTPGISTDIEQINVEFDYAKEYKVGFCKIRWCRENFAWIKIYDLQTEDLLKS